MSILYTINWKKNKFNIIYSRLNKVINKYFRLKIKTKQEIKNIKAEFNKKKLNLININNKTNKNIY